MNKTQTIIILAIIIFFGSINSHAATLTVTKSTNSNDGVCDADCSLREAVAVSNSGDRIIFNSNLVGQTFTLGGSAISFNGKRIEIDGNLDGTNVVSLSGSNTSHHFNVGTINAVTGLTLKNMILVQGKGNLAGSLQINDASLFLDRVAIRNNTALNAGAIYTLNFSTAAITNSSITGNTTTSETGYQTAAIFGQILYLSNTTVSNNRSLGTPDPNFDAGTIYGVRVYLRNCTITENQGIRGGGFSVANGANWFLDVGNSIIAGNTSAYDGQDIAFIYGGMAENIVSRGGNLIGNTANLPAGIFNQTNDQINVNPLLAPANSNQGGHPIFTHPLQAGSPALNTGINSLAVNPPGNIALTNDGRGTGFPRISGGTVDKGAFEDQTNGSSLVVTKLADGNDNVCDTDCSLREAVRAAGIDPGADNITFAANVFGILPVQASIGGEINIINQDVNIIGYPTISAETLVLSGQNNNRIFRISGSNVNITGLTLANGNSVGEPNGGRGGAIFSNFSTLVLDKVIFRSNRALLSAGVEAQNGTLVVRNSTFNNNAAESCAALSSSSGANVYMTNTTVSTNSNTSATDGRGSVCAVKNSFIRNSTIANNRTINGQGAGLYIGIGGDLEIGNTILSNNTAPNSPDLLGDQASAIISLGGNLVQNTNGFPNGAFNQTNDVLGVDPLLQNLTDNGGFVPTIALDINSPAANKGVNSSATDPISASPLTGDARGFTRISGGTVDKGAFEVFSPTAAPVSVSGRVTVGGGKGLRNAVVTLVEPSGAIRTVKTSAFGYYRFDEVTAGGTCVIGVQSKRYAFAPQIVSVTEDLSDLDFAAVME